jgi:hypothetical protein
MELDLPTPLFRPHSLGMQPCGCVVYPPPIFVTQSGNTFGGLGNFLLDVKNIIGDYKGMENRGKSKMVKEYIHVLYK